MLHSVAKGREEGRVEFGGTIPERNKFRILLITLN